MYQTIIKNGILVDGSGSEGVIADIAISNGLIVSIAPRIEASASETIDAKGQIVCPGFVDIQNHSDSHWQIFDTPNLDSLVAQGITTIIIGNSGASLAPLVSKFAIEAMQKWRDLSGLNIDWQTFGEFVHTMSKKRFGCNIASLVGYETLRRGVLGNKNEQLDAGQIESVKEIIKQAFAEGALGISLGFNYAHEKSITNVEMYEIAELCASSNRLLSIHLANEESGLADGVREVAAAALQTGANLKIAHLKSRYHKHWHQIDEVVETLDRAWHKGANLHFDVSPYNSTWQPLYTYLPKWAMLEGREALIENLSKQSFKSKILHEMAEKTAYRQNLIIASTTNNLRAAGKSVAVLAKDMEMSIDECVLSLIVSGGSEVLAFEENTSQEIIDQLCSHPLGLISTNGSGYALSSSDYLVHPRCFGAFPKFLRQAIDSKKLSLGEAIRKCTLAPAKKAGLISRGLLAVEKPADLVIFDPAEIDSRADLDMPFLWPKGINAVMLNGSWAFKYGNLTSHLSGKFLT